MADKLRATQQLEQLQARYIGTGHADTTKLLVFYLFPLCLTCRTNALTVNGCLMYTEIRSLPMSAIPPC